MQPQVGSNIKYFLLLNARNMEQIHFESLNPKDQILYNNEINNIVIRQLNEARQKNPNKSYANKIASSTGIWYFFIDLKSLCYLILVEPSYKQHSALQLLQHISEMIQEVPETELKPQLK